MVGGDQLGRLMGPRRAGAGGLGCQGHGSGLGRQAGLHRGSPAPKAGLRPPASARAREGGQGLRSRLIPAGRGRLRASPFPLPRPAPPARLRLLLRLRLRRVT